MTAKSATSRVMWFFAIVYAVEGIGQASSGILGQPVVYYLKQVLGWEPVKISAALALLDIPWVIKPLWGAISDFIPLFGYRRRTWLVAANLLGMVAFAWVASLGGGALLIPALVVTALAMAVSSTLCGALLVETGQKNAGSGDFVNQQWLWFNIAQMITVLLAGWLIDVMTPSGALRTCAWIAAVAPVAIISSVWMIDEERATIDLASLKTRFHALTSALRTRNVYLVMGFLFLYYFSPGFGTPLYFMMTDELHFSQGFIGALASIGSGGWILGGFLYRFYLRRISSQALLRLSILGGVVATLAYLLLMGPVSAVLLSIFAGVTTMIAFVATLSLAADSCPEGAEGFAFAGMMSVLNLAQPLSNTLGSVLYEHVFDKHLPPLIVVSAVATGLVFFLVPFMAFRTEGTVQTA
jgi:MFS family permease